MVFTDQSWNREKESDLLLRLRIAYEDRGYRFQIEPNSNELPSFLKGYRPDAIAIKGDDKIIIEVKSRKTRASDLMLSNLRARLDQERGWSLDVIYGSENNEDLFQITPPSQHLIEQQIAEIENLLDSNHVRAAFILSWSLLEAALNRLNIEAVNYARNPGQVIQALALRGYLERAEEHSFRRLSQLRNCIVHGDLTALALTQDVNQILIVIRRTLLQES